MSHPSATAVRRTLRMTLRCTGDVWCERRSLHPHVALRLADHHLHASGIIPRIDASGGGEDGSRLYEHDWACVSQSSRVFRVDGLLSGSLARGVTSTTYVERVGGSSLHLANSIRLDDDEGGGGGPDLLSTSRRVFCRRGPGGDGPAPFDDDERERLSRLGMPGGGDGDGGSSLPKLARFGPSDADLLHGAAARSDGPLLSVRVGPADVNFGNHGDHAFLARTAHHALVLSGAGRDDGIAIEYLSETFLGDVLDCFAVEGGGAVVVVARRDDRGGRREMACVAL